MIIDSPEDAKIMQLAYNEYMRKWAENICSDPEKLKSKFQSMKWALDRIRQKDEHFSRETHQALIKLEIEVSNLIEGSSFYG